MSATRLDLDVQLDRLRFALRVTTSLPLAGVCAVFGASASGKTTLLRCIAGLEPGCRGRISVNGEVWQDDAHGVFVPPHARHVGYVFQDSALFPHLSVHGNLEFALRRGTRAAEGEAAIAEVSRLTGSQRLLGRRTNDLSGGEKQRVAVARALLSGPRLLLLDEPLASLDDGSKFELLGLLDEVTRHGSVPALYVTHSLQEVARLADRVLILADGAVRTEGPVQEILTRLDPPPRPGDDTLSMVEAHLHHYDSRYRIAELHFKGGVLRIPSPAPPSPGAHRLIVRASDVSLCLSPPAGSSVINTLEVTLDQHRQVDECTTLVRCRAGNTPIVAAITTWSFEQLGLGQRHQCFAQVKGTSLLRQAHQP
jgi:molybdate transport system ATP-binding protein